MNGLDRLGQRAGGGQFVLRVAASNEPRLLLRAGSGLAVDGGAVPWQHWVAASSDVAVVRLAAAIAERRGDGPRTPQRRPGRLGAVTARRP